MSTIIDLLNQDLLNQDGFPTKRVASTYGGEYASPCPDCKGKDRFRVWPEQGQQGRYWCRECDKKGDAIQYLRDFRGYSFQGAKEYLGLTLSGSESTKKDRGAAKAKAPDNNEIKRSPVGLEDYERWKTKSEGLVKFSHNKLMKNQEVLEDIKLERGLTEETIRRFKLGLLEKKYFRKRLDWGLSEETKENGKAKKLFFPSGLVIPAHDPDNQIIRIRIRKPKDDGYGKYHVLPGSDNTPMEIDFEPGLPVIIVEGEFDAILLSQELKDLAVGVVALGSASSKPDQFLRDKLTQAPVILVALDSDEAGGKQSFKNWLSTFKNAVRTPVPVSYGKDFTDAFLNGLGLRLWFEAVCPDNSPELPPASQQANQYSEEGDKHPQSVDEPAKCRDIFNELDRHGLIYYRIKDKEEIEILGLERLPQDTADHLQSLVEDNKDEILPLIPVLKRVDGEMGALIAHDPRSGIGICFYINNNSTIPLNHDRESGIGPGKNRLPGCKAFPSSGRIAGAPLEWCLKNQGSWCRGCRWVTSKTNKKEKEMESEGVNLY